MKGGVHSTLDRSNLQGQKLNQDPNLDVFLYKQISTVRCKSNGEQDVGILHTFHIENLRYAMQHSLSFSRSSPTLQRWSFTIQNPNSSQNTVVLSLHCSHTYNQKIMKSIFIAVSQGFHFPISISTLNSVTIYCFLLNYCYYFVLF